MATSAGPSRALRKRPRADSDENATASLQSQHYTIGWICALPVEMSAAEAMLDRIHDPLPRHGSDTNAYTLGSIGAHNVVIACLPKGQYGTNNAATVASNMVRTFEHIKHGLLVGIGGAIPGSADVRLGDVVVSTEVIQYDMGKATPNRQFHRTGYPTRPPQPLLTAVSKLQASHDRSSSQAPQILYDIIQRNPEMIEFARPMLRDRLFLSDYLHHQSADTCDDCDQSRLVNRRIRKTLHPEIHYGRIASGNQVIKDAKTRDQLSKELDSICFEMEAAGLMNSFPSLVIRGICDYSDSHKNKQWQKYAAAVAAAYTRELLLVLPAPAKMPILNCDTVNEILQHLRAKQTRTTHPQEFSLHDQDADECLQALFITDPSRDRDDIIDAKGDICQGTCEWILSTDEFRAWQQSSPHLLWISAPPGKGKTYMSIYLSQHFEHVTREDSNAETIFFFCDNKHETRNTAINILRGLIYQLVMRQRDLIYLVLPHWKTQPSDIFEEQSFNTLWKLFEDMIAKLEAGVAYCVIDGLDECDQTSLSSLLRKFEQLSKRTGTLAAKMKLLCLSRRYPERIPEALFSFQKFDLDVTVAAKEDVKLFISKRVLELSEKKSLPPKLRDRIETTFQQQSEDTFLWVSYMAQYLERKNLWEIEATLKDLPQGLDAVYERILSQIDLRNQDVILRMLGWILVATRPLRIPELCEAVQVQPTEVLSREEICLAFIRSCGHFLQVTLTGENLWIPGAVGNDNSTDEYLSNVSDASAEHGSDEYNTSSDESDAEIVPGFDLWQLEVTFVHQSAKDYLVKSRQMIELRSQTLPMQQLNDYVASHLIGYLSNLVLKVRLSRISVYEVLHPGSFVRRYPLANYALHYWYRHFRELDNISQIIWQNEEFFTIHSEVRAACCRFVSGLSHEISGESTLIPLLHTACSLGLSNLAKWDLEQRSIDDIEIKWGWRKWTPIFWACNRGHEEIASLLLDAGANPAIRDMHGETLFSCALRYCGRDLLRRVATDKRCAEWLEQESSSEETNFLCRAASHGNEEACRYLIEELGWDVNRGSPLIEALYRGQLQLARIFVLEWNARLHHFYVLKAAWSHYNKHVFQQTVKMLVEDLSVDINAPDKSGCNILCTTLSYPTPWSRKDMEEQYRTFKTMLQLGYDPSRFNQMGKTPLHCYAESKHFPYLITETESLELMLCSGKLGINHVCKNARTILQYFVRRAASLTQERLLADFFDFVGFDDSCKYVESSPAALQRLLDLGADRHLKDKEGHTALDMLSTAIERDPKTDNELVGFSAAYLSSYFGTLRGMILVLESYQTVVKECTSV